MNCLPSNKFSLNSKSKLRPLISAAQKYEQRIKSSKKPNNKIYYDFDKYNKPVIDVDNATFHKHVENWLIKSKEIDNWRKNVENDSSFVPFRDNSPTNTLNSKISAVTDTSTLYSAGQIRDKISNDLKSGTIQTPTNEKKLEFTVTKSTSIPIFKDTRKPKTTTFEDFEYDDDVFVPNNNPDPIIDSNKGLQHSSHRNSAFFSSNSNNRTLPKPNDNFHYRKLTPQPVKRTMFVPLFRTSQTNNDVKNSNDRYQYENNYSNNYNIMTSSSLSNQQYHQNSYNSNNVENIKDYGFYAQPFKKNIHKTESYAKIILKNASVSHPTESNSIVVARSQSMKDTKHQSNNTTITNNPAGNYKTNVVTIPQVSIQPLYRKYDNNNNTNNTNNNTTKKFHCVPKVDINKTFTMRFSYGSEPSLISSPITLNNNTDNHHIPCYNFCS